MSEYNFNTDELKEYYHDLLIVYECWKKLQKCSVFQDYASIFYEENYCGTIESICDVLKEKYIDCKQFNEKLLDDYLYVTVGDAPWFDDTFEAFIKHLEFGLNNNLFEGELDYEKI